MTPRTVLSRLKRSLSTAGKPSAGGPGTKQELAVYWQREMGDILETWGRGNAWDEIQLLLANCHGRVLDVACGTGVVIEILGQLETLEVHGCDISDYLIERAKRRGLAAERLTVCDATRTPYADGHFDHSYSIGSLEHFTAEGIGAFVAEMHRITQCGSMHMVPVSRSGRDEGWVTTNQSYHNNSVDWWLAHFQKRYPRVRVFPSAWSDAMSVGRWFVCAKLQA